MGAPVRKNPPKDAAARIQELAADGFSKRGIALKLGTSPDTLRRWMDERPELQVAMDAGRETEHHELFNALFTAATEKGNVTAAIFLLKARHGYREGDQGELANKVSVTFNVPGALPLEVYQAQVAAANPAAVKAVRNERYRVGHDRADT